MLSATSCIKNRCVKSALTLGDHSYSMLMVMFHSCMCSMLYNGITLLTWEGELKVTVLSLWPTSIINQACLR